jgi:hypothetical protein
MGNPTPKVYFSSLDKQPKEKITRCLGGSIQSGIHFFVMGKSKMHMRKGKN